MNVNGLHRRLDLLEAGLTPQGRPWPALFLLLEAGLRYEAGLLLDAGLIDELKQLWRDLAARPLTDADLDWAVNALREAVADWKTERWWTEAARGHDFIVAEDVPEVLRRIDAGLLALACMHVREGQCVEWQIASRAHDADGVRWAQSLQRTLDYWCEETGAPAPQTVEQLETMLTTWTQGDSS